MANHLENHPHAFLDENNVVIAICLFSEHNADLIEQAKIQYEAADAKCCCDFGLAHTGGDFYNGKFYPSSPGPEWVRDESAGAWVKIT